LLSSLSYINRISRLELSSIPNGDHHKTLYTELMIKNEYNLALQLLRAETIYQRSQIEVQMVIVKQVYSSLHDSEGLNDVICFIGVV